MMVTDPTTANSTVHAAGGYGPPGGMPPGGGYGGPPPGGAPPGGYGGPMMPGAGGDVNTTLPIILGVISCLCCGISFILGVVGIVLAVQAGNAKNMGDIEGARSKAKTATILGAVGIGLGLLLDVVWGIINVAANS